MATFRVGQRVSFYDDDDMRVVGTVEEVTSTDVLVRVSPESVDFYNHSAWEETRNGVRGRFWWVQKSEVRLHGPPHTISAISALIVSELTK